MQKLSKVAIGRSYTIQWMFGVPEVMDFLREHHVEEGDNIQIIRKLKDALIVGVKDQDLQWEMKLQTGFRCRK